MPDLYPIPGFGSEEIMAMAQSALRQVKDYNTNIKPSQPPDGGLDTVETTKIIMENMNDAFQLEGMDRVHTICHMIEALLGYADMEGLSSDLHKSIHDDKSKILLATGIKSFNDLYQHIGSREKFEISEE